MVAVEFRGPVVSALVGLICVFALVMQSLGAQAQLLPQPQRTAEANFPFPGFGAPPPKVSRRATVKACLYPWSYSRSLGRCICLREGYALSNGRCTATGTFETHAGSAPRAATGEGDVSTVVKLRGTGGPESRNRPSSRIDAVLVQQCLKEAGYLKGEVTDTMDEAAWTAFWFFKQDHPVGATPDGIANAKFQRAVFALCPETVRTGAAPLTASALDGVPANDPRGRKAQPRQADDETPPLRRRESRPELGCLPDDLHSLVLATYGPRPGLSRCQQTCIAAPKELAQREARDYEVNRGVVWCQSCVELGSYMALDDILRLERGTKAQICARPPSRLPRRGEALSAPYQAYTKVRAIYRAFKPSLNSANRIAVVIGNRTYGNGLPANETAHSNAGAVYALLTEHLGYGPDRIIDLRDATLKELRDLFGAGEEGALERRLRQQPDAQVLIYYTGHASTTADRSESYLLPSDAVLYRESRTGYPVSQLYADLRRLQAQSVLVLLEASFSRDHSDYVFAPNLPEMNVRNLPSEPAPGLTVIAAADRDQKTLDDPQYGIGLFTRYLIEGLAGEADSAPIGNGDGRIDMVELYAFTSHLVRLAASKSYGLMQRPTLSRQGNIVLSRLPGAQ